MINKIFCLCLQAIQVLESQRLCYVLFGCIIAKADRSSGSAKAKQTRAEKEITFACLTILDDGCIVDGGGREDNTCPWLSI